MLLSCNQRASVFVAIVSFVLAWVRLHLIWEAPQIQFSELNIQKSVLDDKAAQFPNSHCTCFQGADFLQDIETPELANKIASLNTYDLQNMQMFIEIIFELNVAGTERIDTVNSGFLTINSGMRVNRTVMNRTMVRKSLPDGHDGDGSVIGAGCFVAADDMVLEGRTLRVAVGLEH